MMRTLGKEVLETFKVPPLELHGVLPNKSDFMDSVAFLLEDLEHPMI